MLLMVAHDAAGDDGVDVGIFLKLGRRMTRVRENKPVKVIVWKVRADFLGGNFL